MVAAHWLLSMMGEIIECRKRKRHAHAPISKISFMDLSILVMNYVGTSIDLIIIFVWT
jgi:hypothetical protein